MSRALAGGNENSSEDMGALIRNSDKIREQTDVHLSFIHHSGKDASRGGRGWSGVTAAIDTEIELKRHDDVSVAKVRKQRDLEEGEEEFSALVDDAAVLASIALQYGASLKVLAGEMGLHGDRTPASVLGCALDRLVELLDEEPSR